MQDQAMVDSGRALFGRSSGKWAGEQFLKAATAGHPISPAALRTLDTLRKDEWKLYDEELLAEAQIRLRGVAALVQAGLVKRIPNGLSKTLMEYEKITDTDDATVSLDGVSKGMNADAPEFSLHNLPLPITHKDWFLNLRQLLASRTRGEPLDTTYTRLAGRKIGEKTEDMLFNGYSKNFGGSVIYGLTTETNRNLDTFGTNGNWAQVAKTGANCLEDVQSMITLLEGDRFYGPYWLFVGADASMKLAEDYKAMGSDTIRQRLLQLDQLQQIIVCDKLTSANLVMIQATSDVVCMVEGEPLQTVQWDIEGGMQINFKGFQIMVPLVRSDPQGRSGVVHMS